MVYAVGGAGAAAAAAAASHFNGPGFDPDLGLLSSLYFACYSHVCLGSSVFSGFLLLSKNIQRPVLHQLNIYRTLKSSSVASL